MFFCGQRWATMGNIGDGLCCDLENNKLQRGPFEKRKEKILVQQDHQRVMVDPMLLIVQSALIS